MNDEREWNVAAAVELGVVAHAVIGGADALCVEIANLREGGNRRQLIVPAAALVRAASDAMRMMAEEPDESDELAD